MRNLLMEHKEERWCEHDAHLAEASNDAVASQLRYQLNYFLLHRIGDYKKYLRFTRQLNRLGFPESQEDSFLQTLAEYYADELPRIEMLAAEYRKTISGKQPPILLAVLVWGEKYISPMLEWALPSFMSEGNLDALLNEREVILLFHTNEEGRKIISDAPIIQEIQRRGAQIRFLMLHQPLLSRVGELGNNKYWHLGMVQSLHLYYAQALDADFHIMLPDKIYASRYFTNLLRLSKTSDVVLQGSFRTRSDQMLPALLPYRQGDVLTISAADLAALSLNHLHPCSVPLFMNYRLPGDHWPAFHALLWEGKDELHLISPHQDMVFLSRKVIAGLPQRFYFTLDSEIDKIIPEDCSVACPKAEDGLVLIEFSPCEMYTAPGQVNVRNLALIFWQRVESMKHLRFFEQDIVFPINPSLRAPASVMSRDAIEREKKFIRSAVRVFHPATYY
jgi:hypothetical protein